MEVVQVIPNDDYKVIVYFVDGRICKYDKWNCIDIDPYVIYEKGEKITDPLMQPA